jgi:hypothetical protein
MIRFPSASTATALGPYSEAAVAGPPSPEKPQQVPLPATVVMTPLVRHLSDSIVKIVRDVQIPGSIHGDTSR